jgi:hypothetical protein
MAEMNRRSIGGLAALLIFCASTVTADDGKAGAGRYGAEAKEVTDYIQKTFLDTKSGVYIRGAGDPKPDYIWRQAAMFSVLAGAARNEPRTYRPLLRPFFNALNVYWDGKAPVPGYEPSPTRGNGHDKYYDDNAWLVITFAEAFHLTGDRGYLTRAQETANFVASGWDEELGGGIWWHALHKDNSKNTCANGPAAVGYLCLARYGPAKDRARWMEAARKAVEWTQSHLQASDGLYDDRVIVATGEVKKGKLTYNAALMLRANLGLYHETGEMKYLEEAKRIAKAAQWFAAKDTGVYRDPLKWSQFMVEADIALYRTTGEDYLISRARTNADGYFSAWKKEKPADMMSNAGIARFLWLLADLESEAGRAFWKGEDEVRAGAAE